MVSRFIIALLLVIGVVAIVISFYQVVAMTGMYNLPPVPWSFGGVVPTLLAIFGTLSFSAGMRRMKRLGHESE